ncbi:MAG TPA: hemolysin family protein [Vicinamibacteria bacterium]|nr:hemolysin family protein [Vicinamibacteria bacterium]
MFLLVAFVAFALSVSFLCSLLEAALLSTGLGTLSAQKEAGSRGAALLLRLKETRVDDAISAILILNTLANTLGATMAGAQAARVFGSAAVGIFSGVLTLLILVFSEIIPKTLGALYAPRLSNFVGYTLTAMTRVMAPALALSRLLTRLLASPRTPRLSKRELAGLIAAAARQGALSVSQTAVFENLLRLDEVKVADVMTPRPIMTMMRAEATAADLLATPEAEVFSRIPLYADDRIDNVVGYVLLRDVLKSLATGGDRGQPLSRFLRPVWFVPATLPASAALTQCLERREPLAVAVEEHGGVAGVVTLEDLTETVLGAEIVDELDRVVDLRKSALDHRDRRLERLRRRREDARRGSDGS